MTTLTEFLLARIAEDEATARERGADAMTGHRWKHAPENVYQELQGEVLRNARRSMAECEAKRRIMEGATYEMGLTTAEDWLFPLLALPYADHPDYRDEWRP